MKMSSSEMTTPSTPANLTTHLHPFLKFIPPPIPPAHLMSQAAFELHKAHLMDFSARLRYPSIPHLPTPHPFHVQSPEQNFHNIFYKDPRRLLHLQHEEPKPAHSYIGLIAMAILSSKDKKLVLSDIYQWILDNYAYFRTRGPGWRNSIRHNLSLNDCFIKAGRSANGKGHYWAIHPANVDDFSKGDFRRRRAQRKVRKHMGLTVPEEEESPSPPPPPTNPAINEWRLRMLAQNQTENSSKAVAVNFQARKKRLFDVESLLAPDTPPQHGQESDIEIDVTDKDASTLINSDDEKTSLRGSSPEGNQGSSPAISQWSHWDEKVRWIQDEKRSSSESPIQQV
ncbi:unnamed protein product [Dimorphilus gyrociliatus]|uniref:Fork-head domain-containing protein n=1 Tax=Dimorphilus gyrociliatus TaxID=2664684 RepID=A0A7I8WCH1_9ANNE|nr:unnamed protein product [Dimorphilus gyrociliatus]